MAPTQTPQPPPPPPPRRSSTNTSQRKRRNDADTAERLRQYGVDLPQIPGLPLAIIPLHVFALKTTTQCFRNNKDDESSRHVAILPYHIEVSEHHGNDNNHGNNGIDASLRNAASGGGNNVMDRILDRVAQAAAAATTTATATMNGNASSSSSSSDTREQLERKRKDAIATWLNAIHRQVKDEIQFTKRRAEQQEQHHQQQSINGQQPESEATSHNNKHSIVVSALEHLWSIGLDHDRIDVRRAALHMAGHLLQKSADARSWLLNGGSVLATWLDILTSAKTATQQQRQRQCHRLWQREGYLLLQHLDAAGCSDFYPRLPVALQRLEQEFPWMMQHPVVGINISNGSTTTETNDDHEDHDNNIDNNNNMVDWRKWRDLAMEHCDEEARRVHKLLAQCQVYMDVLVPRVGANSNSEAENDTKQTAPPAAGSLKNDDNDSDDDDEDDVAWEDGFDKDEVEGNDNDDEGDGQGSATQHAANVERTLQVMQTAAGLQGGELEINLQQLPNAVNIIPTTAIATASEQSTAATSTVDRTTPQAVEAWSRLEKTVAILSKRHKRRLSMWVNGLTHADGLVQQQQQQPDGSGNGALVQMSRDKTHHRQQVLDVLVQLKNAVARTLSLAKRLGTHPPSTTTTTTNSEQSTMQPTTIAAAAAAAATTATASSRSDASIAVSLATPRQRHQSLTATLMRQQAQPNRPQQHRRVQIKYRKK